jgi:predicted secreted protein
VILRTAGTHWVRATNTESSLATGVQSGVVVTPHLVANIVVSGMTTPRLADSTGSIRVTAVDAVGRRVYGYRGTVHFTSSDAAANLPADYTFTAADNGTHVFVANVILKTLGTWSVTATDTASPSLSGTQTGIVVNATPLSVSGLTTPRIAGTTGSIRVTAVDASGNRIPGYLGTIHFSSSDPLADLPPDYTFTAADNGTHVFVANVILKSAGTHSVTAVDTVTASIKGAQTGIGVEPAALFGLRVSGMTTPRTAGSTGSIRVTAIDPYGNRIWGYRGTVHFTSSDAAANLPYDYKFAASDNGTHVFFANVILKTLGTWSVTATDTLTPSITGTQTGVVVR